MDKQAGLVPIFLIVPALILMTAGVGVGAYYYSRSQSPLSSVSSTSPTESPVSAIVTSPTPQPFDSPLSELSTPLPLNSPTATSEAVMIKNVQEASESAEIGPKCGIIFETSFEVFVESGDTASTISQKAISQYLNSTPKIKTANDKILSLSSVERMTAGAILAKTIASNSLKPGTKLSFPCSEVEKACFEAQKQ